MKKLTLALAVAATAAANGAMAATPSTEEMWAIIQQQQAQIAELTDQLATTTQEIVITSSKVDATATMVEEGLAGASTTGSWTDRTTLGSYGEMHYNNLEDQNSDNGDNDKDEIDFHRFVLFVNHEFSDRTRLYSELELEHSLSGDGKNGEVELEQAYIEHDIWERQHLKMGLFLVPVGLLNETHEPDTFYGVERNNVEKNIIPTTWWEGGVAMSGEVLPGLNYDASFTSGLKLDATDGDYKIRDGRQKVSEADASDPAYTAALSYTGIAGLELGAALNYQVDLYQGEYSEDIDALLYTAHAAYNAGPFGVRALYAAWDIDSNIEDIKTGASAQEGWYVEPSWRIMRDLGLFARYSEWDNQADGGGDTEFGQWDIGVNYWLEENVVVKFDYQIQDSPDDQKELEGFNLGVGWSLLMTVFCGRKRLGRGVLAAILGMAAFFAYGKDYLSHDEFLSMAFASGEPQLEMLWLTADVKQAAKDRVGWAPRGLRQRYWQLDNRTAWILEHIGKEKPITLGVVVQEGHIERVEVLAFRESRGWEIRYPFFTDQFGGLQLAEDGYLSDHIDGITGATLSVRATEKMARLALWMDEQVSSVGDRSDVAAGP